MPQVDIETLVSACAGGGSERRIACETQADTKDDDTIEDEDDDVQKTEPVAVTETGTVNDYAPESFWLSKDAEFDWFDRNAIYERKESTKGISHSTSTHVQSSSKASSQRFSKASIIGLPKTQKANFVDGKRRNVGKPANILLLPKRPAVGKQASTLTEPSSPKVSCMGKVRSRRRSRRASEPAKSRDKPVERSGSIQGKPVDRSGSFRGKPVERSISIREKRKVGFGSKFMAIFRAGKNHKKRVQKDDGVSVKESTPATETKMKSLTASKRVRENIVTGFSEPMGDPPALGGMKRFASGRRSTEEFDPPALGGMKQFSSGRRSSEEFDGGLIGTLDLERRVASLGGS